MPLDTLAVAFSSTATDAMEYFDPAHAAGHSPTKWLADMAQQGLDLQIARYQNAPCDIAAKDSLEQTAEQNRAAYGDSPEPLGEDAAAVHGTATMEACEDGQLHKKGRVGTHSSATSDADLGWSGQYVFEWPRTLTAIPTRLVLPVPRHTKNFTGPSKIPPISPFFVATTRPDAASAGSITVQALKMPNHQFFPEVPFPEKSVEPLNDLGSTPLPWLPEFGPPNPLSSGSKIEFVPTHELNHSHPTVIARAPTLSAALRCPVHRP